MRKFELSPSLPPEVTATPERTPLTAQQKKSLNQIKFFFFENKKMVLESPAYVADQLSVVQIKSMVEGAALIEREDPTALAFLGADSPEDCQRYLEAATEVINLHHLQAAEKQPIENAELVPEEKKSLRLIKSAIFDLSRGDIYEVMVDAVATGKIPGVTIPSLYEGATTIIGAKGHKKEAICAHLGIKSEQEWTDYNGAATEIVIKYLAAKDIEIGVA